MPDELPRDIPRWAQRIADKRGMSPEAIRRALEVVAVAEWIGIVMAIMLGVLALEQVGVNDVFSVVSSSLS